MNALVSFRANNTGHLTATADERQQAARQVSANLRTELLAKYTRAKGLTKAEVTEAAEAASVTSATNEELDRDAFLQLLVTQMQHQDPLEPMDNSQMVSELAQFSSLEQMENLNSSFESLAGQFEVLTGSFDQLNFMSAQGLLGKYVEGVTSEGAITRGTVDSVALDGSIVVLSIEGERVPMPGVLAIAPHTPDAPLFDPQEQLGE